MRFCLIETDLMLTMRPSSAYVYRILLGTSYILIFILGLYPGRYPTIMRIGMGDVSSDRRFFRLGTKYRTDKVLMHHYELMYDKYLPKYLHLSDVSLLEIGLGCGMPYGTGASAHLWRDYFGPHANIHFLEYNRTVWRRVVQESWNQTEYIRMHYGSQEDVAFLKSVTSETDSFDIIVDDGGHTMKQQITSLMHLFSKVRSGGIYVIEDLETSYVASYGGDYGKNSTTIEFIKRLVDDLQSSSPVKSMNFSRNLFSYEISDQICFFNVR